jgi:hypothetical protein
MEEVFGLMGQAILAAIGAAGIIALTIWLFFGTDGTGGPLGKYILAVLGSVIGA